MLRLLRADWYRLRKNKTFYILLAIAAALTVVGILISYAASKFAGRIEGFDFRLSGFDSVLNSFSIGNNGGLCIIIGIALMVGKEYSHGTIRNKLTVGHTREAVFLSNFIMSLVFGFIMVAVMLIINSAIALPLFEASQKSAGVIIRQLISGIFIVITASAICNTVSMLSRNLVAGLVINLVLVFAFAMIMAGLMNIKASGVGKEVLKFFTNAIVYGQSIKLSADSSLSFFIYTLVSSLVVTTAVVVGGMYIFKRLDLK